jgi:hypothetical protein
MLRIAIVAASALLTIGPALADGRNNLVEEERTGVGIAIATSQALANATHNTTISQQGGVVTASTATQMGVSMLYAHQ